MSAEFPYRVTVGACKLPTVSARRVSTRRKKLLPPNQPRYHKQRFSVKAAVDDGDGGEISLWPSVAIDGQHG